MIHRAPMTRKEMTEDDIKYRQGRRKEQVEGHAIGALIGILGIIGMLLLASLFGG